MRFMLILLLGQATEDTLPKTPMDTTQGAIVIFLLSAIVLAVVFVGGLSLGRRRLTQGQPWLAYGNFFIVVLGLTVVIIGFLLVLIFLNRFANGTQALGFLTALFGAVAGLVGTYFGIKASSDAAHLSLAGTGTTPPLVSSVVPRDGDQQVDPQQRTVSVTFSKDMRADTITRNTFQLYLMGEPETRVAAADPTYDQDNKRATLTADNPLEQGSNYRAIVTTAVTDREGNALAQDYTWQFRTRS